MEKQLRKDMTEGKILPQLLLFALPLLGSSLVQQLYNTADLLFVGNYVGKTAAAAVGSSGLVFTCLIGLFTGISVGVGIVIAHAWGAGNKEEAFLTAQTAMIVGIIGSLLMMISGLFFAEKILIFLRTPKEILNEASIYVRIYFLSMIPMVIYNMGSGILRACGDSKVPFYILIGGGIANVLADALLIIVFPNGVVGVAVATTISQLVSAFFMLYYLMSSRSSIRLSFKEIHYDFRLLKKILKYGLPAGIQAIIVTLSNVVVQYYINGFGENAVAAYTAYFKIENFIYLPIMACGQAVTTFAGQNYGAEKYDRIKKGTVQGIFFSCGVTVMIAVVVLMMPETVVSLFIRDDTVIAYGVSILMTTFPLYWLYAVLEVTGGTLRGMGYSNISMLVVMLGLCGLRILMLFGISRIGMTFETVAKVYPITWSVTAISFVILFFVTIQKCITNKNALCKPVKRITEST